MLSEDPADDDAATDPAPDPSAIDPLLLDPPEEPAAAAAEVAPRTLLPSIDLRLPEVAPAAEKPAEVGPRIWRCCYRSLHRFWHFKIKLEPSNAFRILQKYNDTFSLNASAKLHLCADARFVCLQSSDFILIVTCSKLGLGKEIVSGL